MDPAKQWLQGTPDAGTAAVISNLARLAFESLVGLPVNDGAVGEGMACPVKLELVGYATAVSGNVGRSVGTLYFANTLGGAIGAYLTAQYLFRFTGTQWVQEQKLTASDAAYQDNFGWSVSVGDGVVLVGATA